MSTRAAFARPEVVDGTRISGVAGVGVAARSPPVPLSKYMTTGTIRSTVGSALAQRLAVAPLHLGLPLRGEVDDGAEAAVLDVPAVDELLLALSARTVRRPPTGVTKGNRDASMVPVAAVNDPRHRTSSGGVGSPPAPRAARRSTVSPAGVPGE